MRGLEPPRLTALEPKSSASTSSATSALRLALKDRAGFASHCDPIIENHPHLSVLPCHDKPSFVSGPIFLIKDQADSMADPVHLISYGTLQLEQVQLSTFGRLLTGRKDAMPGWRMEKLEITDPEVLKTSGERFHPIAVETGEAADAIAGTVFTLTAEELAHADAYEVSDYKRVAVRLQSGLDAWVYVKA